MEFNEQIHEKGHHIKSKLNHMLEKDHSVKCTTFATVPLINHFGFNWKNCVLSCKPIVLIRHLPLPCKLMLNIDSTGCNAVVCLQGECLKWWSYTVRGEKINVPSASYSSLSSSLPAAQLTLQRASHARKPSGSCSNHVWPGWVLAFWAVEPCVCPSLSLQPPVNENIGTAFSLNVWLWQQSASQNLEEKSRRDCLAVSLAS